MYEVFKQLANGEFVFVAEHESLKDAVRLVQALKEHWPGQYEVRDSVTEEVGYKWAEEQETGVGTRV